MILHPSIKVTFELPLKLNEAEARALDALVGYGTDSFLEVFYKHLGKAYLQPYEPGLVSLFETIRKTVPGFLRHLDDVRKAAGMGEGIPEPVKRSSPWGKDRFAELQRAYVRQLARWQDVIGCKTVEEAEAESALAQELCTEHGRALEAATMERGALRDGIAGIHELLKLPEPKNAHDALAMIRDKVADLQTTVNLQTEVIGNRDARVQTLEAELSAAESEQGALRFQLEALTKVPEGDVLADWSCPAPRNPDQFGPTTLETIKRHFTYGESLEKYMNALRAEVRRSRSQLATVTAERDWRAREILTEAVHNLESAAAGMTANGSHDEDVAKQTLLEASGRVRAVAARHGLTLGPVAATTPQATPPSAPEPMTLTVEEAKAAVERGMCVETFYPDNPEFVGCVRAIRFGELRVFDPRYPSRGWAKMGMPGHWPDEALFRIVPDPSQEQEVRS